MAIEVEHAAPNTMWVKGLKVEIVHKNFVAN